MYQDAIYTNRNMSIGIQSAQNNRDWRVYQTRGQVTCQAKRRCASSPGRPSCEALRGGRAL